MRLVTYRQASAPKLGVLFGEMIVDLALGGQIWLQAGGPLKPASGHWPRLPGDMLAFLRAGQPALQAARQTLDYIAAQAGTPAWSELYQMQVVLPLAEVYLCAPILRPGKLICIGANYPDGLPGSRPPEYPVIFLKPASGLVGSGEPVQIPPVTRDVAYEAELALVIGKQAKYLRLENALDCVAGYTQANDVGARDLEKRSSQWTSGKLMDTFSPLGPALVTRDEIRDPGDLALVTHLNGELVQRANTGQMYFKVPELVRYLSQLTTLEPGDVILTGSPKTIDGQPAPLRSLKPGDCVEISIGDLGVLRSPVIAEAHKGWKR